MAVELSPKAIQVGGLNARPGEKAFGFLSVSTPAGQVEMPIAVASGQNPGPCLALVAGMHGCEFAGIQAAVAFMRNLDPSVLSGSVISINIFNVPAFQQRTAYVCPLDGKNPARVFPGDPTGSPTEIMATALMQHVIAVSDYVIELHGGDIVEDLVPFVIFNRTGNDDIDRKTLALARSYGFVCILQAPSWDGHFTNKGALYSTVCEAGKPGILTEAGGNGLVEPSAVEAHRNGIQNAMRHLGMLPGSPVFLSRQSVTSRYVSMRAPLSGMLHPQVRAGDIVTDGALVGEISDYFGKTLAEIRAPIQGTILFVVTALAVQSGEALMGIAGFPLETR